MVGRIYFKWKYFDITYFLAQAMKLFRVICDLLLFNSIVVYILFKILIKPVFQFFSRFLKICFFGSIFNLKLSLRLKTMLNSKKI